MALELAYRYDEKALHGKYGPLYKRLRDLSAQGEGWETTFGEIESILGFELPPSARRHRSWWANKGPYNAGGRAKIWNAAGCDTAEVDMEAETLSFKSKTGWRVFTSEELDELLPPRSMGPWPEGFSARREEIYDERM